MLIHCSEQRRKANPEEKGTERLNAHPNLGMDYGRKANPEEKGTESSVSLRINQFGVRSQSESRGKGN